MRVAVPLSYVDTEHAVGAHVWAAIVAPSDDHRSAEAGRATGADAAGPPARLTTVRCAPVEDVAHWPPTRSPAPESATRVPAGLTANATAWNMTRDAPVVTSARTTLPHTAPGFPVIVRYQSVV